MYWCLMQWCSDVLIFDVLLGILGMLLLILNSQLELSVPITFNAGSPLAFWKISSHCGALLASHHSKQFLIGRFASSNMTTLHAVVSTHNPLISERLIPFVSQAAVVTFRHASPKHVHQSSGFCSAHPTCGKVVAYGTAAVSTRSPWTEKRPTRALSVPKSTPITYCWLPFPPLTPTFRINNVRNSRLCRRWEAVMLKRHTMQLLLMVIERCEVLKLNLPEVSSKLYTMGWTERFLRSPVIIFHA